MSADLTLIKAASGGYAYRPLKFSDGRPVMRGADVFAMQSAANWMLAEYDQAQIVLDGFFGPKSAAATRYLQTKFALVKDGIWGIATPQAVGKRIVVAAERRHAVPAKRLHGQVEHECGWIFGNFTPTYSNETWDRGPAQENSGSYPFTTRAFTVAAIEDLAAFVRRKHDEYAGLLPAKYPHRVTDPDRLWDLAQGAWNAWAWTDKLARGVALSVSQSEHIERYIAAVTMYA